MLTQNTWNMEYLKKYYDTALYAAVNQNNMEMVRILLAHKNINCSIKSIL